MANAKDAAAESTSTVETVAEPPIPARKPRPNHQRTLQVLRAMTPQEKLAQVFKLNARTLKLMRIGLRRRFPDLDDAALERVYLQMRERCRNRNY